MLGVPARSAVLIFRLLPFVLVFISLQRGGHSQHPV